MRRQNIQKYERKVLQIDANPAEISINEMVAAREMEATS